MVNNCIILSIRNLTTSSWIIYLFLYLSFPEIFVIDAVSLCAITFWTTIWIRITSYGLSIGFNNFFHFFNRNVDNFLLKTRLNCPQVLICNLSILSINWKRALWELIFCAIYRGSVKIPSLIIDVIYIEHIWTVSERKCWHKKLWILIWGFCIPLIIFILRTLFTFFIDTVI